ncbi:MAG: TonB-dependent receptor [Porticoccaceae bacterium]|nr:TonB-dependent receptor [Porticoccaceae bacterium]
MFIRSHHWAIALTITLPSAGLADHKTPAANEITDILVTAPDTQNRQGATTLGKDDFAVQRTTTSDTASLLKNIPGVSLYGAGGVSSLPVIHGLADDRLRIQVDGMDLVSACGNHMNPPLSYIDPNQVDTIEVFTGVSPVSQGGDSIGGSISVHSIDPTFAREEEATLARYSLGSFYRSNGNSSGANLSAELASHRLNLNYSGAFAKADNYHAAEDFKAAGPAALGRSWLEGDEVGSTAYETQNHKLSLATQWENHLLAFSAGYQHIPYQGFPNQRMDMLDNTSVQLSLRHHGDYEWGNVETSLYRERTRHEMNFGDDKQFWYGDAPGMPMDTEGENTGLTVAVDYKLSETDLLTLGTDIQRYRLDDWWSPSGSGMMMSPNTFWNIRDGERDRDALFGEWQSRWNSQWSSIMGVRYERVTMDTADVQGYSMMYTPDALAFNARDHGRTDDNWDFSALVYFTPDNQQSYSLGLARKTRSPNLYERYTWSTVGMAMRMVNLAGDGNGYVGNLDLEPEIAHTLSFSADWHDNKSEHWQLSIAPYYTLVDDYIDAAPCTTMMCNMSNSLSGFRYLTFANNDARLFGVDISGFWHLATVAGIGDFSLHGMVSYVDGENTTTDDNLYNIMPLNGTFRLEHSSGTWSNSLELQLVSAKDNVSAVRNELDTAGYGLVNLRSSYSWQQLRLDVGVENALDKGYELPLGGAYLGQGMTMSPTGVPYGVAVPGMGRSFYVGINLSF